MGVSLLRPLTCILIPYSPAWAFFFVDNSPLEPLYRGSALFTKSRCDIKAHAESSLLTLNLKWVERNLNMLVFPHQTSLFPSYDLSCFLVSWAPGSDLGGFCMFPTWGPSILSQNSPRLELAPCGPPCWQPKSSTEFLVGYHLLLIHLLGKCLLRVSCGPGNMSSGEGGSGPAKLAVSPVSSQTGGACTLGWCACWELGRGCLHWGTSAQGWRMDNEWASSHPSLSDLPDSPVRLFFLFLHCRQLGRVCWMDPPRTSLQWECPLCAWAFSSGCGPPGPPSAFICCVSSGTRGSGVVRMVCRRS